MRYSILSLFPDYFVSPFGVSILKRAIERGLISVDCIDIRSFATGKHKKVDDRPFGGGPGMLLMPEPTIKAIRSVRQKNSRVIYLSPQGPSLTSSKCQELAKEEHLVFLCGHYEGIDERVIQSEVDEELSIGDYVLTSGCPAAMVVIDAVSRFIPGVLGHEEAAQLDSFQDQVFDAPHYTHPEEFEGVRVPEVLRSGNHQEIEKWRKEKALVKARHVRPDLFSS